MKIATFNINGIRARLAQLLDWLAREAPDVACLQELKCSSAAFPVEALRRVGYEAVWLGQQSWNGVAILSRHGLPIETRRGLPGLQADTHSRYIEAAVQGIIVGCLYLPNGNPQPGPKFDYKLQWFDRLLEHAQSLIDTGHPVVLAGDYNVVPTDLDIYDPKHWKGNALLQPASRARYEALLAQGWTDALRRQFGSARVYTFWDYFRQHWPRDAGLRIDHLLLSPTLRRRQLDAGVDRWVRDQAHASDHAPTWVQLKPVTRKAATVRKPRAARPTAMPKARASKARA